MTPMQVLRAARVARVASGGPGALVYRSTGPAVTDVATDSCSSFSLSRERDTLQDLNRRLESYLQQVQRLESANQKLERQIQEELDKKCPTELRQLGGLLRTVSLLQDQISEGLSAQAQVRLQLLGAELAVYDLSVRCEKERERRGCVEAELRDLRQLEEELRSRRLLEIQNQLTNWTQHLMELQTQHRQDTQALLVQMSGGVPVLMQSAESSDLIQQLDDLRKMSVELLDENRKWFNAEAAMLRPPEVTFAGSQLEDLRRTAVTLEEELTHLQVQTTVMEASGLEQTQSFHQQLLVLQQRADALCRDLDSVLQAAALQAEDHQVLLDTKTRLEAEIQDYRRLLDRQSQPGITGLTNRVTGAQMGVQMVPRDPVHTVRPVLPLSETLTTIQPIWVHSKHQNISAVRMINTSDQTSSVQEKQTPEGLSERIRRESMTVSMKISRQSSPDKYFHHREDLESSSVNSTQISQGLEEGAVLNIEPGLTTLSPAVQAKPVTSKKTTTGDGFQMNKTGTNVQTRTSLCAEPEVKEGPHGVTHKTTTDPSKETAAEDSIQAKNQDQDQVGSLETLAKSVVTASVVSGSPLSSEENQVKVQTEKTKSAKSTATQANPETSKQMTTEAGFQTTTKTNIQTRTTVCAELGVKEGSHVVDPDQAGSLESPVDPSIDPESPQWSEEDQVKVSDELTFINNKDTEQGGGKAEEEAEDMSSKASQREQNKDMKPCLISFRIPDKNPESKTSSTEILKAVKIKKNKGKVNSLHDTNQVKVEPESDNETAELLSKITPKKHVRLVESQVALRSPEGIQDQSETHVSVCPTNPSSCLSPSPAEMEVLMTNQVLCPVDPEEHPVSLLSPNDPEMFLSLNDFNTCLSPVEAKGSPNDDEEDICLNLIEVRPVERYILSTKEEDRSLSFGSNQDLPKEISLTDGNSMRFGSFEGNNGRRGPPHGSRPASQGIGLQLGSLGFGSLCDQSIIAAKEEQLSFGGLYRKSVMDARRPRERYQTTSGIANNKEVQSLDGGTGGKYGSGNQYETSSTDCLVAKKPGNSEQVFVRSTSFGSIPANSGTNFTTLTSNTGSSGMVSALAASFGVYSSGTVSGSAEAAEVQGRYRQSSGSWMVYGGSLRCGISMTLLTTGRKESPSEDATSQPETGRFCSRGSGEWEFHSGSLGSKSCLGGGISSGSEGKEVSTKPATSAPETGRFSSRGSGEWMVYGGSLKHNDSSPITESRQSTAMHLPTSPTETGRYGGSGEWRVYGGSTGHMSSGSLSKADSEESLSAAMQLAAIPLEAQRAQRFGSGEWKVYGGSDGCLSSTRNTDRVSTSYGHIISPPSSHTSSGPRLSSGGGSGGRLSSGSVVRRSSSVGSGVRLSSSGSGNKLSSLSRGQRSSISGSFTRTGSSESKPIYISASGCRSTARSTGRSSGGGSSSSQRARSPGGTMSVGSSGWLNSSTASGSSIGSPGSRAKLSSAGSSDRISNQVGGGTSRRANSTGGRVITSSDRLIRSTGSSAGSNKERISVCKMAALKMSAERSQDRRREAQQSQQQQQQQQQQAAATSPLVQRWLISAVGVMSAEPDDLDDIMHL